MNKTETAAELARVLSITDAGPKMWLRGQFTKHNISHENFAKIVMTYRGKEKMKCKQNVINLAKWLYGNEYERALELVEILPPGCPEPADDVLEETYSKENLIAQSVLTILKPNPIATRIAENLDEVINKKWLALAEKLSVPSPTTDSGASFLFDTIDFAQTFFSPEQKVAFSQLGGVPQLSYYDLDFFNALWQISEIHSLEYLGFFQKLGIIRAKGEKRWEIDADMLNVQRQYFLRSPKKKREEAVRWGIRALKKRETLSSFQKELVVHVEDIPKIIDFSSNKKKRKTLGIYNLIPSPFLTRLKKTLQSFGAYDADWDVLQEFSEFMSPKQFLYGLFLQSRWKVIVINSLGIASLLHISIFGYPLPIVWRFLMGLFGIIFFARIMLYLHKIEEGWINLWEETLPLIPRK